MWHHTDLGPSHDSLIDRSVSAQTGLVSYLRPALSELSSVRHCFTNSKRLRCSVIGCNHEHSCRHLLPTSEPLRTEWSMFVFEENAPLNMTLEHKTKKSRWGIFVAIDNNTLYGSKWLILYNNMCIIVVFISCLDSHSDGTHSLHCWYTDAMLHFSKPDEETNSSTFLMAWWLKLSTHFHFWVNYSFNFIKKISHSIPLSNYCLYYVHFFSSKNF